MEQTAIVQVVDLKAFGEDVISIDVEHQSVEGRALFGNDSDDIGAVVFLRFNTVVCKAVYLYMIFNN